MNDPLFSIIIPTYNREAFIKVTIESVLAQTYSNFEIIVVDDGSTDNTEAVVRSMSCDKLFYYKKENQERAIARNFGIKKAAGDYINFLDSDDIFYPDHLKTALELIQKFRIPEFFHLGYEVKNNENDLISVYNNFSDNIKIKLLSKGNMLSCNGVFLRKDIALANLFNEQRMLSGSEDYELWIRLICKYPLYYSNTITSVLINHPQRSVTATVEEKLIKRIECLQALGTDTLSKSTNEKKYLPRFLANTYIYLALHLIINHQKKNKAFPYIFKAMNHYPEIIFNRSFIATLKHLIIS